MVSAVLRLHPEAYGVRIRDEIEDRTGRSCSVGAVYTTLRRLQQKGFVRSWEGEPTPERGGRSKRLYAAEPEGVQALETTLEDYARMVRGIVPGFTNGS